ncbi:MAG TPA: mannitol dehydrogenase family protein, partial [Ruminiclostridium sp.]|nr:mannitol dehydrogenase family protein [Ruminiclostridium sp.]
MKLNKNGIKNHSVWADNQILIPKFDYDEMLGRTKDEPKWLHFGAGNIFRGFIAALQQNLLDSGKSDTGIIVAETFDYEIIDKVYKPFDNMSLLVHLNPDGSLEKKVIGSVAESLVGDTAKKEDWERLKEIFRKPSLQIVSFTVTEKGYSLTGMSNEFLPDVLHDMQHGWRGPKSLIAKTASLLYGRYLAGELPVAMVSMDNCSHNGDILKKSIQTLVQKWVDNKVVEKGFLDYINNPAKVSFPCSMIDKITPRPSETVSRTLAEMGLEDTQIIRTGKNTYISQFVNAEKPQYLVIEDQFPNGRMPLEDAGVYFTDKPTVENVERMKVTTCLNPLHTALAVFGCLLGYTLIADEMKNTHLRKLIEKIGYDEGMPVVINPGIIEPQAFIDEVINQRFPNPYIPDTPQRILGFLHAQNVSFPFCQNALS